MRWPLMVAAVGEGSTGLALVIAPALVGRLLLGEELSGSAEVLARVVGIALVALGVACYPGPAYRGMLFYIGVVAAYLAYVGLVVGLSGVLLWPAVALHVVLFALLVGKKDNEHGLAGRADTKESP